MENMSQNTKQTNNTLKIDGIAYISAFTTIWLKQITNLIKVYDYFSILINRIHIQNQKGCRKCSYKKLLTASFVKPINYII